MLNESTFGFDQFESVEEGCRKLAQFLKLEKPVSRDVFVSMVEDSTYAANIIMTRHSGNFLNHLLASPPHRFTAEGDSMLAQGKIIERSNTQLLKKAAQSLLVWTGSGAQLASDEVYQSRLSACAACPHYIEPPKKLIYKAAALLATRTSTEKSTGKSKSKSNKMCNLCGCITANKAKLATEFCPDSHPDRPGYTRWNEPQAIMASGGGGGGGGGKNKDAPTKEPDRAPIGMPASGTAPPPDQQTPDCPRSVCLEYRGEINNLCKQNGWPPDRAILVYDPETESFCNCFCS